MWYTLAKRTNEVALTGTLKSNGGFIYLSVDSRIIAPFLKMIDKDSVISPKEVTDKDKDVGAHISVIKKKEYEKEIGNRSKGIKELGESFEFYIDGLESVEPDGWDEVKKVYFIAVNSKPLEALRKSYGLPSLIDNHSFHITVGVEKS